VTRKGSIQRFCFERHIALVRWFGPVQAGPSKFKPTQWHHLAVTVPKKTLVPSWRAAKQLVQEFLGRSSYLLLCEIIWMIFMWYSCDTRVILVFQLANSLNFQNWTGNLAISLGWLYTSCRFSPITELNMSSWTSRSLENNCFHYVFHSLIVLCKFHSIFFPKFIQQKWTSSLHDIFT
jgi:hypothetical protein